MTPPFWEFIDEAGTFRARNPRDASRLYFPLGNEAGLLSAITPDLHGDIKTDQHHFLMPPVSELDLMATRYRRDLWVIPQDGASWHANGPSPSPHQVEAGVLWHRLTTQGQGWSMDMLNFTPATNDPVELMLVTLTNQSKKTRRARLCTAIPLFGRSADNLRDHRHVTSLLHRLKSHPSGVVLTPTMSFDERGHRPNHTFYAVLGADDKGRPPAGSFPTVAAFVGEGGDLDRPRAVLEKQSPPTWTRVEGRESMGALSFANQVFQPGESRRYAVILGVGDTPAQLRRWLARYGTPKKMDRAWDSQRAYWRQKLDGLSLRTGRPLFDGWFRWVSLQPTLRKIFGCSFLPDFDYGRGGRGWRDLWQDCLALLLQDASLARPMILNNAQGVRMDGTNATIIGRNPGEFIADRNNIPRVWMDHGVWPWLTTELYLHQTGDFSILKESLPYFRDPQLRRARERDLAWTESYGRHWKTRGGRVHQATLLEHLLLPMLTAFFNVGEHGMLRLEDADWNDGLDMARERGESVAFSAQYAGNLLSLAEALEEWTSRGGPRTLPFSAEALILLDSLKKPQPYGAIPTKRQTLERYIQAVTPEVSGRTTPVELTSLAGDLRHKGESLTARLRKQEWLTSKSGHAWFNGYYDNQGQRLEGDHPLGPRMTLTGQVFPILSGVATEDQIGAIWRSAQHFLKDPQGGGFRLNTNFGEIQPHLGRAFAFSYGDKENGAVFSHMAVMFANALYRRGHIKEGREVLDSLFRMATDTARSRLYPTLPEYFDRDGRGLYSYLTGSASWLVMTEVTLVCGMKGLWGDFCLQPRLLAEDFGPDGVMTLNAPFAGHRLTITFRRKGSPTSSQPLALTSARVNGRPWPLSPGHQRLLIPRPQLNKLPSRVHLEVTLTHPPFVGARRGHSDTFRTD